MDWLLDRFSRAPQTYCIYSCRVRFSYAEMVERIASFSTELKRLGIGTGDTVVVLADYAPNVSFIDTPSPTACIVVPMTHGSVIEEKEVLAISGCDKFISFSGDGLHWALKQRNMPVSNILLDTLRAEGRAGLVLFSSGWNGSA